MKTTYFYVEAEKLDGDKTKLGKTVLTQKVNKEDQREAIWLYVYRTLKPNVGDSIIITCIDEISVPESIDEV